MKHIPLSLKQALIARGIPEKTSKYLVAVSAHETGFWTSEVFKKGNNLWGMRLPSRRKTTANGEVCVKIKKGLDDCYANYNTIGESIEDIVLYWQALNYPLDFGSLEEMIGTMKEKGYFEASYQGYLNAVRRAYSRIYKA